MKKLSVTLLLTFVSVLTFAQCGQVDPPRIPTDLVVIQSRPNSDVHLNWNTSRNACYYTLNLKIVTKVRGGYVEQQAAGYPIQIQNNLTFPQQDMYDQQLSAIMSMYRGAVMIKYELAAVNDVAASLPVCSEYMRIK